ncbi:hypothetical protein J6590_067250 [Homalodisca vitripennis]|nr:hypothetical protein J6590_067250 [Homalodisca vitripennis]
MPPRRHARAGLVRRNIFYILLLRCKCGKPDPTLLFESVRPYMPGPAHACRNATPPAPLPSPLQHPPPPPRPPATTPQPMGEQQAPHLTRAMADERWRTVSWRMNKNLCLRRPVSEPGPLRMRDCRADHWTTETSCAWRRDMAVRAARGARRYRRSAVVS